MDPTLATAIVNEYKNILASGLTLVNATGVTGIFDARSHELTGTFGSVTRIAIGNGRPPVSPIEQVFAKRPFDMAIHPSGRRALAPFFQTGNFGVLDLDAQKDLTLQDKFFQGYVGVTPTHLDGNVWPINPEDVALLFPRRVQYAQNGRFAVAVHAGSSGHQVCKDDPANNACKQSGVVSVIDNEAITRDLNAHRFGTVTQNGTEVGYYTVNPIDPNAVTHHFSYSTAGGTIQRFVKPSGVAIQPILTFLTPRAGDLVVRTTEPIHVQWNTPDDLVEQIKFRLEELDNKGNVTRAWTAVNFPDKPYHACNTEDPKRPIEQASICRKEAKIEFYRLLGDSDPLLDRTRLRINVTALDGSGQEVTRTAILVTFQVGTLVTFQAGE